MLRKRERDILTFGRILDEYDEFDTEAMLASLMMLASWEKERVKIDKGELK